MDEGGEPQVRWTTGSHHRYERTVWVSKGAPADRGGGAAQTNPFVDDPFEQPSAAPVLLDQTHLYLADADYVPAVSDIQPQPPMDAAEVEADQRVSLVEEKGAGGSSNNLAAADHSKVGLFSAERWTAYFDVDTSQVLQRIHHALLKPHEDFLDTTGLSPDLYGPFWIVTTLIFVTAAGGSAVDALDQDSDGPWVYDVGEVTFSAMLLYGYAVCIPVNLWLVLTYLKEKLPLMNLLCLYGYSLFVFIPVAILSMVDSEAFRWIMSVAAVGQSTAFLVLSLQRHIHNQSTQTKMAVLAVVACLHALLGLVLKLHFFQYW